MLLRTAPVSVAVDDVPGDVVEAVPNGSVEAVAFVPVALVLVEAFVAFDALVVVDGEL